MAVKPAASPPPTHHEKTSTCPLVVGASVAAGASVAGISVAGMSVAGASVAAGPVVAGASVAVAAGAQAESTSVVTIRTARRLYHIFLDIFFFSLLCFEFIQANNGIDLWPYTSPPFDKMRICLAKQFAQENRNVSAPEKKRIRVRVTGWITHNPFTS